MKTEQLVFLWKVRELQLHGGISVSCTGIEDLYKPLVESGLLTLSAGNVFVKLTEKGQIEADIKSKFFSFRR